MQSITTNYPTRSVGNYIVFGTKKQGHSHLKTEKPCQDAFFTENITIDGKTFILIAVADGHGSSIHDLSQYGSDIAALATVEMLRELCRSESDPELLCSMIKSIFPQKVMSLWKENVISDYQIRFEKTIDSQDAVPSILKRYGTTLLFAVVCENGKAIVGRLGDGNIVFIGEDGTASEPFPETDELVGGATYSMCHQERVLGKWQIKLMQNFKLLTLSTDGLANSFEDDSHFCDAIKNIHNQINTIGVCEVAAGVPQFLEYCSTNGSGDDITIMIVYNR